MSWLGRSFGELGNDAANATFYNDAQKQSRADFMARQAQQQLSQLLGTSQLQELKQRISQQQQTQQQNTPEGRKAQFKAMVGRDPTQDEALQLEGIAPQQGAPADKVVHTYVNGNGKQVAIYQRADNSTYEKEYGDVNTKDPAAGDKPPEVKDFGGFAWEWDPKNTSGIKGNRVGPWVQLGRQKDPTVPQEKPITPAQRNTEVNSTLTSMRMQLTQAMGNYKQAQAAHVKHGSGLMSRVFSSDVDPTDAKGEAESLQKAINFIEANRADIVYGKKELGDIVNQALAMSSGGQAAPQANVPPPPPGYVVGGGRGQ